jgi:DNA helicase-2/ATP-dependent DNA helicase PcrA
LNAQAGTQLDEIFKRLEFEPTTEQLEAIASVDGPQLLIAGPGSGKTEVLVLRTLYLMLVKKIDPSRIVVCTYTEKAAASLRDRIRGAVRRLGLETQVDLTELWVGTIHSICGELIDEFLDETNLTKGYAVLDDITQPLFLYQYFYQVIQRPQPLANSKWPAIKQGIKYFTKMTEDLVDVDSMEHCGNKNLESIARKYKRYEKQLESTNSTDFAHLQSYVLDLLNSSRSGAELRKKFDYIMVDEYQDTNYVQEQIFLKLAGKSGNLCVVGDEDQSLYRFRGAVVQNFLSFPSNFKEMHTVKLERNFRSTPQIVDFVNSFIMDTTWNDGSGKNYRYDKTIRKHRQAYPNEMKSVYRIQSDSPRTIAKLVKGIIDNGVVVDPNQIAILLKSVSYDGGEILRALDAEGIKYYATRARGYFKLREIRPIIGLLLLVLSYTEDLTEWNEDLTKFYQECLGELNAVTNDEIKSYIVTTMKEIAALKNPGDSLKKGIVDIFYEILALPPFKDWIDDPIQSRNISILSSLLTRFQEYYRLPVLTGKNYDAHRKMFVSSFLYSMREMGLDEYEDPYDVFPSGYVQVMTIHQAKGLEFPVVIVGSLDKQPRTETKTDKELEPFSHRKHYEPYELVSNFDFHRLFYVAFSRAMDLLILASDEEPNKRLAPAFQRALPLTTKDKALIMELKFRPKEFLPPKPEFSITGDIHAYDVCARQYMYYKEYEFTGSRSSGEVFGTLVHYTIEDIHLHYLKNKPGVLDEKQIKAYFAKNYYSVSRGGAHPLAGKFLDMAYDQVVNYYNHNKDKFDKLVQAEHPILVDREKYVMSGVIDLIRGDNDQIELLDFKAQTKEDLTPEREEFYKFQLSIYAKLVERKLKIKPSKTYVYLTAETNPKDALREIPIQTIEADAAERAFDQMASKIMDKDFKVARKVDRDVCRNCDFRYGCADRKIFYPEMKT